MPAERRSLPVVRVFSGLGCHLCELLIEELKPLIRGKMQLEVLNIEDDERWLRDFRTRIPVVEIGGRFVCQYRLDPVALESAMRRGAGPN